MKYASYDEKSAQPTPVTGWYDADTFKYPILPVGIIELSDGQWNKRMSQPWFVSAGKLVPAPTPTAAQAKADALQSKTAELTTACAKAITGGYASSALGSVYQYPSSLIDQQNMAASVLASTLPNLPHDWTTPFWCADSKGVWAFRDHTAAQIQQAGTDGKAWVIAQQQKLVTLLSTASGAKTAKAVQAVVWA